MEGEAGDRARCRITRCFCLTLRQGVIIIAALELTTFVSLITYNGVMLEKARGIHGGLLIVNDMLETIIHFGVALLLVIGVWRERRQLVWAWVYTRIVVLATDVLTVFLASTILVQWPYIVFSILLIPIYIVFITVVRSYALELRARDKLEPTVDSERIPNDTAAAAATNDLPT